MRYAISLRTMRFSARRYTGCSARRRYYAKGADTERCVGAGADDTLIESWPAASDNGRRPAQVFAGDIICRSPRGWR